ncbi:phenylacetate--CoA ligase family protein [Maridesulfovibrio hydrothermalis]|uniref:Two-component fusion protein (N:acyl-CoA reductase-C:coenzyme F390 synthetase) n=1 Tax=Maridesulfovibrio hydrothermalis AM13 = DSM 14728 TaxID=1121451 RepID=L0RD48_9BACT|nr:phenylacetate--CoA ligase family protein [Maridesulfovibrio hydrothermalis]CCO24125.1 Two-component fusion protein (N:acyl-CoA reductase-C:coenzyme F390 synthetase) [Maridesulfovibrio hydrothermalis AM13 = DSM 14728]
MTDIHYADINTAEMYQLEKLNQILSSATEAPFYKKRYKGIELPLKNIGELSALPVIDKQSLCSEGQTCNNALFTRTTGGFYTFSTGGTSGRMTFARYGLDEFSEICEGTAYGLAACGIAPGDVVANCIRAGAFWTGFLVTYRALEQVRCNILPITDNQPIERTLEFLEMMRPNTLFGISPTLVQIAQEACRRKVNLNIEKVGFASTPLTTQQQDYLTAVWPDATFHSAGYGAAEVGPIGFQCKHCTGTQHHILQPHCIVERDDDGGIIATSLIRTMQPAIRMKVGDNIEWIDEPCPCGRTSPRFKLLQRSDEILEFNHDAMSLEQIGSCLGKFKQLAPVFQVRLELNGNEIDIIIRVEAGDCEAVDDYELASNVYRCLSEDIETLGKNREKNNIRAVKVLVVPTGGIPRIEATGKIRRVIDKRF